MAPISETSKPKTMLIINSDRTRAKLALSKGLKPEDFSLSKRCSRMRLLMEEMEARDRRMNEENPRAFYERGSSTSWKEVEEKDFEEKKKDYEEKKRDYEENEKTYEGSVIMQCMQGVEDERGGEGDSSTGTEWSGENDVAKPTWAQKFYDKEADREPVGSRMRGLETVDFSV